MGYIGQAPANKVVTSADIEDGVVSAADLGANSVDSSELVDGSVDLSHLSASGTKSSSTYLRGDNTFATAGATLRPNAKPLIINGDMQVAQRSTSETGITGTGYHVTDRNKMTIGSIGTYTITQESLTSGNAYEAGFSKAFRIDCTTADASPSAGDEISFDYKIEGQDLQLFKKGTANAETFTLAFWVKSNQTGVGQVNIQDRDNSRMCSATYTISSADTWEHKVLNYASDTTGVFGNDNLESLRIDFWLDSGSNHKGGTAPTAWEATATADKNASGTLSIADSTSNDWAITGLQLEVGTYTSATIPPFQHESYGDNLLRCFRYFYKDNDGTNTELMSGLLPLDGSHSKRVWVQFKTPMRATPAQENSSWSGGGTIASNASQFLNKYSAEAYARDNDDTNAIYYDGSEWNAEL